MINRTIPPELQVIDSIQFVAPKRYEISSDCNLYHMADVPNDTARFDLYFDAGKCQAEKNIASTVNGLLLSGTKNLTALQIQDEINKRGGFMESGVSAENATVSVYCLKEHLASIFHIVMDAIDGLSFHPKEVSELIADRKQKLKISQEKVSFLAQQRFREELFASNDRYSSTSNPSDYDNISREDLISFHSRYYKKGLNKIVVVGDLDETTIQSMCSKCERFASQESSNFDKNLSNNKGAQHIEKKGAIQAALRIGRMLFNKNHPDYLDFLFVNTILGDYFGSRLMTNIREDKGYTYNIGSLFAELNQTGYFLIATQVGKDVLEPTLQEIQIELKRLQNELVSNEELELVKNYMLGQLLKSADGPYAMTDLFISAEMHGEDLDFYNRVLEAIQGITPERIQELSRTYLNWEDMTIVSVG